MGEIIFKAELHITFRYRDTGGCLEAGGNLLWQRHVEMSVCFIIIIKPFFNKERLIEIENHFFNIVLATIGSSKSLHKICKNTIQHYRYQYWQSTTWLAHVLGTVKVLIWIQLRCCGRTLWAVHAQKPSNIAELKQYCKEEWARILPQ